MAKTNFSSMSVEELLQLRDDVGKELNRKTVVLRTNWRGWAVRLRRVGDVEAR